MIDTRAVVAGLKSGKIGHLGLDVYEEETNYFFEDLTDEILDDQVLLELLALPNVLVTSHQAFFTKEALEQISDTTLSNIAEFEQGKPLTYAVKERK